MVVCYLYFDIECMMTLCSVSVIVGVILCFGEFVFTQPYYLQVGSTLKFLYPILNKVKVGQDHDFKVGSLNVRGLNDDTKRFSIFNFMKRNSFDVCYIQESYSNIGCEKKWRDEWGG